MTLRIQDRPGSANEGRIVNESLEDAYPQPRLTPESAFARARPRSAQRPRGQAVSTLLPKYAWARMRLSARQGPGFPQALGRR